MRKRSATTLAHLALILWSLTVLFPIWIMVHNSFKPKRQIFENPYWFQFGRDDFFTLDGFINIWGDSQFYTYFRNSFSVIIGSLLLLLFFGSLAAYGISHSSTRLSKATFTLFIVGLLLPIKLGTINIFQVIKGLGLFNTLYSLFPVYIAMGLPMAIFILSGFMSSIPKELREASAVDGVTRIRYFFSILLPLLRPPLASVAIFCAVPIWNDIWFPLIFIRDPAHKTLILGVSDIFGQFQTDWTKILSALSIAAVPVILLYIAMSKQFIQGMTAGAAKG